MCLTGLGLDIALLMPKHDIPWVPNLFASKTDCQCTVRIDGP